MTSTTQSTRVRLLALITVAFLLAAGLAMLTAQRPAYADTACVVNSLLDTDSTDGLQCQTTGSSGITTLRSAFHRDVVAGGTNTITFANTLALPGTISLVNSEMHLTGGTLTITGPGADKLSINAHTASRIFNIDASATLTFSGLTLKNGTAPATATGGGAILANGNLNVDKAEFVGNTSSDFWGGAIVGYPGTPTMIVTNSAFKGNTASSGGGGIFSQGTVTLTNDTFNGNTAGWGGGFQSGVGTTMAATNTTVSGNASNSNVFGGGGVFSSSSMTLKNTIVSGNTSTTGNQNCTAEGSSTITDAGYNIENGTSCGFTAPNHGLNADPLLKPLANNGGPTDTMALQSTSPARDSAGPGCPTLDQRGQPREGTCDRGAYEFAQPAVSSVAAATTTCVTPGQSVTINGAGFTFATAVKFGSTPATSFVVNSDTKITAVAPAGSGTVDITVTNADGTSATVTNDQVTLGACPAVPTLPKAGAPADQGQFGGLAALLVILSVTALGICSGGLVVAEARRRRS